MPCFGKPRVECARYSLDGWSYSAELTRVVVVAGHFHWGGVWNYLSEREHKHLTQLSERRQVRRLLVSTAREHTRTLPRARAQRSSSRRRVLRPDDS